MKLILIPLAILVVLSICSMLGLGNTTLGDASMSINLSEAVYYDDNGNAKIFISNMTSVQGEKVSILRYGGYAYFSNSTELLSPLYYDSSQTYPVEYTDLGQTYQEGLTDIDLTTSIGLIAMVIALMAVSALVGLRVLGSGVSETSVSTILLGTSLLAVWAIFSVLGMELILTMTLLGPVLYFVLTILYTLGIIMNIGGSDE